METRQIHVRDLSTVTGIQQYEHCVQSIFFLGLEDFEGTIYLSLESDKFSEDVALTNNTFIIGQPMTNFNVTYTCQIYGIVGTGEKIQLSKQFRMAIYKSNNISGEAGEYPIDPNLTNGIDQYITTKESEIDDYVEQVIESIPSDYATLEQSSYNAYPTQSETGNPIYFDDGADDIPVKELIVNLEPKQSGSGDPSPTNIREISGYDGVTVKRTGKNSANLMLYSGGSYNPTVGSTWNLSESSVQLTDIGNGQFSIALDGWAFRVLVFDLNVGQSYRFTCGFSGVDIATSYGYLDENYTVLTKFNESGANFNKSVLFIGTSTNKKGFIGFTPRARAQTITLTNPQLELGTTATDYEPYTGQEYSITFPTSVGTVYGGSLNVTTGELVVDKTMVIVDGNSNISSNGTKPYGGLEISHTPSPSKAYGAPYSYSDLISNRFTVNPTSQSNPSTINGRTTNGNVYLNMPAEITTLELAKSWFADNPTQVVYKLATPTTVQLTPTEVSTLLGDNTVWSDDGTTIDLNYRADTTKVIEKLTYAIISLGGNV